MSVNKEVMASQELAESHSHDLAEISQVTDHVKFGEKIQRPVLYAPNSSETPAFMHDRP